MSVAPGLVVTWPSVMVSAALLVLAVFWIVAGARELMRGGDVETPGRIPQLYGYTVCLIAVIVFLISVNAVVQNAFALADPLSADQNVRYGAEPSVTSFEAYRGTYELDPRMAPVVSPDSPAAQPRRPSETELRQRYEALRADRLAQARFRATRDAATSVLMLLVSAALFVWHWRWLRRRTDAGPA